METFGHRTGPESNSTASLVGSACRVTETALSAATGSGLETEIVTALSDRETAPCLLSASSSCACVTSKLASSERITEARRLRQHEQLKPPPGSVCGFGPPRDDEGAIPARPPQHPASQAPNHAAKLMNIKSSTITTTIVSISLAKSATRKHDKQQEISAQHRDQGANLQVSQDFLLACTERPLQRTRSWGN